MRNRICDRPGDAKRYRTVRSRAIAVLLVLLVLLFYGITIIKLGRF